MSRLLGRGCSCFAVACGGAVFVPLEDNKEHHPHGQSNVDEDCDEAKCLHVCIYRYMYMIVCVFT